MSPENKTLAEGGTSAYVTRFDGVRVPATDYQPVWVASLADDVTIEGSAMNGVVQGAEAVGFIVTYIRTLYDDQEFNFAGPYGQNGFLEDYTARVRGEQLGNVVLVTAMPPGRRSTSWPTTGPGHIAARGPAGRRALFRHPLRRALRLQRPRVRVQWVHFIGFLVLFMFLTSAAHSTRQTDVGGQPPRFLPPQGVHRRDIRDQQRLWKRGPTLDPAFPV